jgi:hypothetical protein
MRRRRILALATLGIVPLMQQAVRAGLAPDAFLSATGTFTADGAEENFNLHFSDPTAAGTTFRTWAWGGGSNAAGDTIPSGGIDSVIEVFNSANQSIAFNDDRGPGQRDSLLSNTGSGVTFMPPLGPGDYRFNLTNSFLALGDGHWAADIIRTESHLQLTGRTSHDTILATLKFGARNFVGTVPTDIAQVTLGGPTVFLATGTVEVRNGGRLHASNATFTAGSLRVTQDALAEFSNGVDNISTTMRVEAGGSIGFTNGSLSAGSIDVAGGKISVHSGLNLLLRGGGLSITNNGTIDLADNDMLLGGGSIAMVSNYIATARHNGAWDQPGLTSTSAGSNILHNTTLGVLTGQQYLAANPGTTTFDGATVSAGNILVKYTYYGDTDLNGRVNFDDYVRTDAGFNNHLTGWANGDYDLNGQVNFDDYVLIDLAFNTQSGTLGRALSFLDGSDPDAAGLTDPALRRVRQHFERFGDGYAQHFLAAVPEPAAVAPLVGVATLLRRRARRRRLASFCCPWAPFPSPTHFPLPTEGAAHL